MLFKNLLYFLISFNSHNFSVERHLCTISPISFFIGFSVFSIFFLFLFFLFYCAHGLDVKSISSRIKLNITHSQLVLKSYSARAGFGGGGFSHPCWNVICTIIIRCKKSTPWKNKAN